MKSLIKPDCTKTGQGDLCVPASVFSGNKKSADNKWQFVTCVIKSWKMKERFKQLISETAKLLLKEKGFVKKGLNFYRTNSDLVFLFNFQLSQGNHPGQLRFYINCGIHSAAIDRAIAVDRPEMVKEYECYFKSRISAITKAEKDGYIINEATEPAALAAKLMADLGTALQLFDSIGTTGDLVNLMIGQNKLNNYLELFEYLVRTTNRDGQVRYVKELHQDFGSEKRWSIFEGKLNEVFRKHQQSDTVAELLNTSA
ncbi:DUF4304 domain-containing protein [Niabella beijingensis]|uniref:DUF4304 domain-containing protein n=1 Tax=Niabella beijingensis TaxID=2872700 RepID=UPI001CC14CA0|nr:DUF4304 domain-containing protein [Niabella beijingensis]MBZ4190438.1 DUF4304 domain-containing protein [Niabella beijingensis]